MGERVRGRDEVGGAKNVGLGVFFFPVLFNVIEGGRRAFLFRARVVCGGSGVPEGGGRQLLVNSHPSGSETLGGRGVPGQRDGPARSSEDTAFRGQRRWDQGPGAGFRAVGAGGGDWGEGDGCEVGECEESAGIGEGLGGWRGWGPEEFEVVPIDGGWGGRWVGGGEVG